MCVSLSVCVCAIVLLIWLAFFDCSWSCFAAWPNGLASHRRLRLLLLFLLCRLCQASLCPTPLLCHSLSLSFPLCLLGSGKWLRVWLTCLKTAGLPLHCRCCCCCLQSCLPSLSFSPLPTLHPFAFMHSFPFTFCKDIQRSSTPHLRAAPAKLPLPLLLLLLLLSSCRSSFSSLSIEHVHMHVHIRVPPFPLSFSFPLSLPLSLSVSLFVRFSTVHLPARLSSNSAVPWPVSVSANVHDFSAPTPRLSLSLSLSCCLFLSLSLFA